MVKVLTIVGLDPGTETGIAVISLEGDLIATISEKELGRDGISEFIIKYGTPLILATDVNPTPSTVEKIASTFNAEVYTPNKDLSSDKKDSLVKDFKDGNLTSHSKDALAAALQAFRAEKSIINKISKKTSGMDEKETEKVFNKTVKQGKSISRAIREVEKQDEPVKKETSTDKKEQSIDWESRAKRLDKKLKRREKEAERLRNYSKDLKKDLKKSEDEKKELLSGRRREIEKDEEVLKWKKKYENVLKQNKNLKNTVEGLKKGIKKHTKGLNQVLEGANLYRICNNQDEADNVEGPILFVHKNVLVDPSPEVSVVVVSKKDDEKFYSDKGFKTVLMDDLEGVKLSNYFIVDEEKVFELVEDRTEKFLNWLEDYRGRR